ncbi:MAG TPA: response regulator [Gemmatimonadaceae bacterium]|nr:response regulator [Gemmatimonadaceae bacterium]
MSEPVTTVLLVDPDARVRAQLVQQLKPLGCPTLEASDGVGAMHILATRPVKLVVTELYLGTGNDECLIHAIRRQSSLRGLRALALTHRSMAADREWAMRAGADAYLIKPTRPERFRYVVSRLTSTRASNPQAPLVRHGPVVRRDSLDAALGELEGSTAAQGITTIVFGRAWWEGLSPVQQTTFRRRAKRAHVNLRSDSMLGSHFVEVRGKSRTDQGLSTERPESPYRR